MSDLFLTLFNRSISAGWLILAVMVIRLFLKKAPKSISCVLWALVAVRLICPFSLESVLSLIPSAEAVNTTHFLARPYIQSGVDILDHAANGYLGGHYFEGVTVATRDSLLNPITFISLIWLIGIAGMFLYFFISYLNIQKKVRTAVCLKEKIYQSENVASPFILGFFRPRIYLPFSVEENDAAFIIAHEKAHIRRKDHWIKPIGFLLLSLYWFHPLLWIAYLLLCRDIELACDEKVVKELSETQRADYSQTLLSYSLPRRSIATCPLAFGENNVKNRVKNILNYKRPAFWIIVLSVLCCMVLAVCFLTNPPEKKSSILTASSYQVSGLLYSDGSFSFFEDESNAPQYCVCEGKLLWNLSPHGEEFKSAWTLLGNLETVSLNEANFDRLFLNSEIWETGTSAEKVRKNTVSAQKVTAKWNGSDLFFYLLRQKDGSLLLCRGFFMEDETPYIRWVQQTKVSSVPPVNSDLDSPFFLTGRYIASGDHYLIFSDSGEVISMGNATENSLFEGFQTGDRIEILCDYILEAYPARTDVYQCRLLEKGTIQDIPQAVLNSLSELGWLAENSTVTAQTAWANYSENIVSSLNADKMMISSIQHLPIFKFDSAEELKRFREKHENELDFSRGCDEVPSFETVTNNFGTNFFEKNTVFLIYVGTNSTTYRYGMESVYQDEKNFCVHVRQLNDPKTVDTAMGGWWIIVTADKSSVASCTVFDADLNNF